MSNDPSLPSAVDLLLDNVTLPRHAWDPFCSYKEGQLSIILSKKGYDTFASDYHTLTGHDGIDFLKYSYIPFGTINDVCIVTIPPAEIVTEAITHSLRILPDHSPSAFLVPSDYVTPRSLAEYNILLLPADNHYKWAVFGKKI